MGELEVLEREVKRRKRMVGEWAAQLHDLAEERLPASFRELPQIAEATYEACEAWQQAVQALRAARR